MPHSLLVSVRKTGGAAMPEATMKLTHGVHKCILPVHGVAASWGEVFASVTWVLKAGWSGRLFATVELFESHTGLIGLLTPSQPKLAESFF